MEKKKKILSKQEILERLIWFHGDELNKYPLEEELLHLLQSKG
jgi:hypothetical protein